MMMKALRIVIRELETGTAEPIDESEDASTTNEDAPDEPEDTMADSASSDESTDGKFPDRMIAPGEWGLRLENLK